MPSMASVTVKKSDGTTDIVFDALSASAGDGVPAVWRQDTGNTAALPVGLRSKLALMSKSNGPKTARQVEMNISFPYAVQDSTTTLYQAKDQVVWKVFVTLPEGIPATWLKEASYQGANLIASALVKSVLETGYAPT